MYGQGGKMKFWPKSMMSFQEKKSYPLEFHMTYASSIVDFVLRVFLLKKKINKSRFTLAAVGQVEKETTFTLGF